jgi:hypothetical protein
VPGSPLEASRRIGWAKENRTSREALARGETFDFFLPSTMKSRGGFALFPEPDRPENSQFAKLRYSYLLVTFVTLLLFL